jgi:hypothetical protein
MIRSDTFRGATGVALVLAALVAAPGVAQDSSPGTAQESSPRAAASIADASQPVDEVVVRGRRLGEIENDLRIYIDKFLTQVAKPARGRGYARWHRSVCIGVHNLEGSAAHYVVDRISREAIDLGLEPGEPGCTPQVNIVFATNAKETASLMVAREPRVFRPMAGFAGTDLGRAALDEFVNSERAVRWWHVSMPVSAHNGGLAIEVPAGRTCGEAYCPPQVTVEGPSRIHNGTIDQLWDVIIIVDATKLIGTTWQQLADYLAVVSLAQINPRTNPAEFDSILNLFSNPAAYSGLTDWDRSYLKALYTFDQEVVGTAQHNEIVSLISDSELKKTR